MKILVVSHEYPPIGGGGANACMFLTKGYAQHGHQVVLVTVWYEGLEEHEIVDGVEIFRVKSKRKHKEHCSFTEMFDYILKALPASGKLVKSTGFDVCQVFFGIPSGPIGYMLKKKYGLPYFIRFGGGDIPGFQDRFKFVYKMLGPAVKIIWKNASALIANSEGLKQFALNFYSKKNVDVIFNGVDTEKFYPDETKRNPNIINLLFVSRLIERKGLQFIIPQLGEIRKATGKDVQLTVVGDGPYRETLENIVQDNGVKEWVHFSGQKNKDELLDYYQAGDLFVFPSKREGMPNAVLEAMACGLPIVMTPCEGSKELVADNGVITAVDEMKDRIIDLVKDDRLRQQYAVNSRERCLTVFSWESVVKNYEAVLNSIVEKK